MRALEALIAISRIEAVYRQHELVCSNVEYNRAVIEGLPTYSVKGTSRNEEGYFSLVRDIIDDVRFLPRKSNVLDSWHPGGFLDAGMDLALDIIERNVEAGRDCTVPVNLEGHSLGGAAVLIGAAILIELGWDVNQVVTFGAPNTGYLPQLKNVDVFCYRNGWDIVPTAPPFWKPGAPQIQIGEGRRSPIKNHALESYAESLLVRRDLEHMWQSSMGRA